MSAEALANVPMLKSYDLRMRCYRFPISDEQHNAPTPGSTQQESITFGFMAIRSSKSAYLNAQERLSNVVKTKHILMVQACTPRELTINVYLGSIFIGILQTRISRLRERKRSLEPNN
ncbi:hypothetical protein T265_09120 [Opisthorchis viverrini]|uniref:Uncharacterized protein n=1 Tax=Opisthorchis viverrini TaxID=6198 RepID=A0A074Z718_OPIVI|nr:hypothetical protein T265_09120 [Opisthorchis viverrini]KER22888.1 hypothetical protein T265_09120 [Opisthorchis viverrini]